MIKYRVLIFFLFSISLVGCTNPAQYIGELFPKANERAIYDEKIEEESRKEVENKEVEKSFFSYLIFWDTSENKRIINLDPDVIWSNDIGASQNFASSILQPTYDNKNTIYTIDTDGFITSTNIETGDENWSYSLDIDVTSGLLIHNNHLFFGASDGVFYGYKIEHFNQNIKYLDKLNVMNVFDKSDIQPDMMIQLKSEAVSPAIGVDNLVYIKLSDGDTVAINYEKSFIEWTHQGRNIALSIKGTAAISYDYENVYVARDDGNLISLSHDTGKLNWLVSISPKSGRNELESLRDIEMSPLIKDGALYVGSYQGNLISVDIISGNIIWITPISIYANLGIDDSNIYASSNDGIIYAIDRYNGNKVWQAQFNQDTLFSQPTVLNNYIITFSTNGDLIVLDKSNGNTVHFSELLDEIDYQSNILLINKILYIVSKNGRLNAIKIN